MGQEAEYLEDVMPVITVSRQTGSGGAEIGRRLAAHLGASYLNPQIVHTVAERLEIPEELAAAYDERTESVLDRLARVLLLMNPPVGLDERAMRALPLEPATESIVEATRQLVQEAARTGNAVIFGHGAQFILAGQPEVLHIRFVAPLSRRVERVMRRARVSRTVAEQQVRAEDHRRATYIREYYHADWADPTPFHLILNTGLWNEDTCIKLVLNALDELGRQSA